MRLFSDCMEMVKEVERDLFEMGLTVTSSTVQDRKLSGSEGENLELNGYSYKIPDVKKYSPQLKVREMLGYMKVDSAWVESEMKDRVDPLFVNPGFSWEKNKGLWEKYLHEGLFEYTYSERFREQLSYVVRELSVRQSTRQAVMTVYDQHQDLRNWGGRARVPCSMHYQIFIREGCLHLIYVMRSCDLLKHFAGDVALALGLMRYVGDMLSVDGGSFTHFMGSLHAFKADMQARGIF